MIVITQSGWKWTELDAPGFVANPDVFSAPAERVSELLGPDGEPLLVGYERPKLGFDLTPKG